MCRTCNNAHLHRRLLVINRRRRTGKELKTWYLGSKLALYSTFLNPKLLFLPALWPYPYPTHSRTDRIRIPVAPNATSPYTVMPSPSANPPPNSWKSSLTSMESSQPETHHISPSEWPNAHTHTIIQKPQLIQVSTATITLGSAENDRAGASVVVNKSSNVQQPDLVCNLPPQQKVEWELKNCNVFVSFYCVSAISLTAIYFV